MGFVSGYLKSHWQGEQSLARSFFINGVLIYLAAVTALVSLSNVIHSDLFFWVGSAIFVMVMIWSLGGIVRAAIGTIRGQKAVVAKILAISALVVVVLVICQAISDLYRLDIL